MKGVKIMLFSKNQLVNAFTQNNADQPKAKYSNNVILNMLDCLPMDFEADIEPTRNGFAVNRGSLVECIIKAVVCNDYHATKSSCRVADLDTRKLNAQQLALVNGVVSSNIEIKFSTSFAPATKKTSKAHKTILVCESGIYMIDSKNIIPTKSGKINVNNQKAKDLIELTELMDLLGY